MAEKVHNRYKVMSYLTEETLQALEDFRTPLGMSRSTAVGMMINTFLLQQNIIDKTESIDDLVNGVAQLGEVVKQMTFEDMKS